MNNSISDLQRLFDALMLANYGSSKTIKLPFFGGYLELYMEFIDGMIRLMSAKSVVLGDERMWAEGSQDLNLDYNTPVGLARDVYRVLDSLKLEGISAEAKLLKTANDDVSFKIAAQVQSV